MLIRVYSHSCVWLRRAEHLLIPSPLCSPVCDRRWLRSVRHALSICWEARRRGLVFGCGHATCVACGGKLAACPICRAAIGIRIRTY